jgi:HPt (histidine-containing phosphotransfer) domain-containing protein
MDVLHWDRDFALEQAGQDEELLAELLMLFNDTSSEDLIKIQEAYKEEDPHGMGDAAHSIKGAAASLGIEDIRQVAHELEKAGRSGDLAGAKSHLPNLETLISKFRSSI